MNTLERASVIKWLREMAGRLPEGSSDRQAIDAAVKDMLLQIPGQVKYGGGAWRCFECGAAVQPRVNHCSHCGKRLEWPAAGEEPYKERIMKKFTEVR